MDLYPDGSVVDHGQNHGRSASDADQTHCEQEPHKTSKDTIVFPSRAAAMQQAQKIAQEAPEMRQELIAQIKHALELGTMTLDSHLVAEKLLGIEIEDVCYAA